MADIIGEKKVDKYLRKQLDKMLAENPDIEISEF